MLRFNVLHVTNTLGTSITNEVIWKLYYYTYSFRVSIETWLNLENGSQGIHYLQQT